MKSSPSPTAKPAKAQPSTKKPVRVRPVPGVTRAVAILRLLGRSSQAMGVKAIADELALVPSTCLHILRALVAEELVKIDSDTKRYSLGTGMLSLARSAIESSGFASLAQPVLDVLANDWNVTMIGVETPDIDHMVVLALSRSRAPFRLHVDVGSRFPALVSATGRLVAAFSDEPWPQIEKRFKSLRWDKPIDLATWKREVELVRKRGFSIDRGNYMNGVTVIAVPLLDASHRVSHTLVATGLSDNLVGSATMDLAKAMKKEADGLSALLPSRR
ncbi:IclR family transcriptional regulator [Variovorax sp. LT1P1]|uniref:IclR family transcriptional regulator n=1 Tax=Variovorax sp. LT1P1 TaxID=3443730 RepID=UPI003F47EC76